MMELLIENKWSGTFPVVVLFVIWILHICLSAYRLHKIINSCDMRLNVRFEERGSKMSLPKGTIIFQIVMTSLIIAGTVVVLLL